MPNPDFSCSFCGKSYTKVYKMIAGPNVHICNKCLGVCVGIMREYDPTWQAFLGEGDQTIEEIVTRAGLTMRQKGTAQLTLNQLAMMAMEKPTQLNILQDRMRLAQERIHRLQEEKEGEEQKIERLQEEIRKLKMQEGEDSS